MMQGAFVSVWQKRNVVQSEEHVLLFKGELKWKLEI